MRIGILSFAHLHAEGFQAGLRIIPGVELVGFSHEVGEEGRRYAVKAFAFSFWIENKQKIVLWLGIVANWLRSGRDERLMRGGEVLGVVLYGRGKWGVPV